jgi:hypothetical protein
MSAHEEFFAVVGEYMDALQMFYRKFADKKPVMQISLPEQRIYAYPYEGYLTMLSPRSQKVLRQQYRKAVKRNEMVVFVRDEDQRTLNSTTVPIDQTSETA